MSIELVTIGDEILRGQTVNTNTAEIGRRLTEEGWKIVRQTTLPDDPVLLELGLAEALARTPLVIATGGLGPTLDDLTVFVAKKLFPTPGEPIPNSVGSAPGFIFIHGKQALFLLPGVPEEMRVMLQTSLLPYLHRHFPPPPKLFSAALHFYLLSENRVDPILRDLQSRFPLDIGIYPSYGTLTVMLRGADASFVEKAKEEVAKAFQDQLLPTPKLSEAVGLWLQEHKATLAFAESCTGGFMASQITQVPGASAYFLGSLVTYANELKEALLGVSSNTLKAHGAVSEPTVLEMWHGLIKKTDADYGIAVSGIAGPGGGSSQKPVGTIYYALGKKGSTPEAGTFEVKGDRQAVILRTTQRLLAYLWRYVNRIE
jgi:PncC family amidohydrolase